MESWNRPVTSRKIRTAMEGLGFEPLQPLINTWTKTRLYRFRALIARHFSGAKLAAKRLISGHQLVHLIEGSTRVWHLVSVRLKKSQCLTYTTRVQGYIFQGIAKQPSRDQGSEVTQLFRQQCCIRWFQPTIITGPTSRFWPSTDEFS